MPALRLLIIGVLLTMAWQDFRSRLVSTLLFPLLAALLLFEKRLGYSTGFELAAILMNVGFLVFQLLVLTVWFSIKNRKLVWVGKALLGWGDILFLLVCCFYFSVLNYVFFYLSSLFFALFCWVLYRYSVKSGVAHVPLAGLQSIALAAFLTYSWFLHGPVFTSDDWTLGLMKWSQ